MKWRQRENNFINAKFLLYCPPFFPKADNTKPLYFPAFYFIVRLHFIVRLSLLYCPAFYFIFRLFLLYCPPFYFIVRLFTLFSGFLLYFPAFYFIVRLCKKNAVQTFSTVQGHAAVHCGFDVIFSLYCPPF